MQGPQGDPLLLSCSLQELLARDTVQVELIPEKKGLFLKHVEYEVSSQVPPSVGGWEGHIWGWGGVRGGWPQGLKAPPCLVAVGPAARHTHPAACGGPAAPAASRPPLPALGPGPLLRKHSCGQSTKAGLLVVLSCGGIPEDQNADPIEVGSRWQVWFAGQDSVCQSSPLPGGCP